tara:strand:+ start:247 stop:840 length:594 start_codon:yes stop_codon:yes gene_type:complete
MLWLLACEDKDPTSGIIPYDYDEITFRLRTSIDIVTECILELQGADFIECSETVEIRNETVTPETETETETENKALTSSVDDTRLMVDTWNRMASDYGLTKVQKLTKARKAKAVARLKDCGGLEGWDAALEKVAKTPGLLGQAGGNWKASFDFLLQESSFVKLMEGSYDNWTDTRRGGGVDVVAQALSEIETERNGT